MSIAERDVHKTGRRESDVRGELLAAVAETAEAEFSNEPIGSVPADHVRGFIGHYYANIAAEDLAEKEVADLAAAALGHLRFAARRPSGQTNVRMFSPLQAEHGWTSTHSVVETANDDMPFLVDSLNMLINRQGLSILLTVHPVFRVTRDSEGELTGIWAPKDAPENATAESMIHVEVTRETDPELTAALEELIRQSMNDVRTATTDWRLMREKVLEICNELEWNPPPLDSKEVEESNAFLRWIEDEHFTFLGYREYELVDHNGGTELVARKGTGLGILRADSTKKRSGHQMLSDAIREQAQNRELLIITKANSQSTVHRPAYLDYIGIKEFDDSGRVIGEKRFLGLFTSVAYSRQPSDIPLLRHKVQQVVERSGLAPGSHAGKALIHILETFPRDELLQSSVTDLLRTTTGVFNLQERQRVKLFVRRDAFGRFISCLVFVPRDKYNTLIRERVQRIVQEDFNGVSVETAIHLSESVLARLHLIVRTSPADSTDVNVHDVERRIEAAVRGWHDELRDVLIERFGEQQGHQLMQRHGQIFPTAFTEDVTPREASFDIERVDSLGADETSLRLSLYRPDNLAEERLRFKVFHRSEPLSISDALPMIENLGFRVISEQPYKLRLRDHSVVWVQDFEMTCTDTIDVASVRQNVQDGFEYVWRGMAENDGFNRLILSAGLDWREVTVVRAYCKYLLQTGVPFSQSYIEQAFTRYPAIASMLTHLFKARFDPDLETVDRDQRRREISDKLKTALDEVASLDDDRILRSFRTLVIASLRTNFYQEIDGAPKSYLSIKLDPELIPELPLPKPMYEIFVYSPRVEGVHLRAGRVARGGIRWSDRREDYRTEVLGLMKAQNVKNTVIVPMGAKGGFVVKHELSENRDVMMQQVINCYRTFISGLLDLTDNYHGETVVAPAQVYRHDGDDPYLVVAADKGTATFSDIANELAEAYDFWLGDAFASGGSSGYDHKKMGITARGGWESVKRHFREIGIDTQTTPFTVAGVGDMSGDVFGNGMLLSRKIRLQAAFNHRSIFIDPDPDPESSFRERERIFALPRSDWTDYNPELISRGGGIFPRSAKQIKLTDEMRAMLKHDVDVLTPAELIRAILKMPVDLLWNGGIGTYVKAAAETHTAVGDRGNDAVRVNARQLRCQVVGEGGNLGLTQLARIEFALEGGRINTDFIDNSGGVDSSDREVNIKILLNLVKDEKPLTRERRDKLLTAMTDEVAALVLRNNYLQSQAISMIESIAKERINEHAHLIRQLERSGNLDRAIEFLPDNEEIERRKKIGVGLSRPELAVLFSYSKNTLYAQLLDSDLPEDSYLADELRLYFPEPLQRRYSELMHKHRLRREIIAAAISNSLVNRMGPAFALRMQNETGSDAATVARAYEIAREIFDMRRLWPEIEALDDDVPANAQYAMMGQSIRLLRHATRWLLDKRRGNLDVAEVVTLFRTGVQTIWHGATDLLIKPELARQREALALYSDIGVPKNIAQRVASMRSLYPALDIVTVAHESGADVLHVAAVYYRLGSGLQINWLRDQIQDLKVEGHWQAVARGSLRDNLYELHRGLTAQVIADYPDAAPGEGVIEWLDRGRKKFDHAQRTLKEMQSAGAIDFPTLSVAIQEIRKIAQSG